MKIKNINGTTDTECVCGSWLNHWKIFSRQSVSVCPVPDCWKTDIVGAHVQKADGYDLRWYIYPLCKEHNSYQGILEVPDWITPVSAVKSDGCGKVEIPRTGPKSGIHHMAPRIENE